MTKDDIEALLSMTEDCDEWIGSVRWSLTPGGEWIATQPDGSWESYSRHELEGILYE